MNNELIKSEKRNNKLSEGLQFGKAYSEGLQFGKAYRINHIPTGDFTISPTIKIALVNNSWNITGAWAPTPILGELFGEIPLDECE